VIALDRAGDTVCGVVSAPALGHRWWASRGGGAFRDGEAIRASEVATLTDAYVSTTSMREAPRLAPVSKGAYVARTYTDFWQYALVAEGSIDVAAEFYLHEWDWKAPKLLVEEAGGRYTIEPGLYVASNAALHDEVIALLRA
jgi:histidinol-phosphatase